MSKIELTDGSAVPEDGSHKELRPDGQQKGYVVLSPEERAKGFVKPVRRSYVHEICGRITTMGHSLAETYARDPYFYSGTFCYDCGRHFPLDQFHWTDGEPMDPLKQADYAEKQKKLDEERRQRRIAELSAELTQLTEEKK